MIADVGLNLCIQLVNRTRLINYSLLTFGLAPVLIPHPLQNPTVVFFGIGIKMSPLELLAGILPHDVFYFPKYQCMCGSTLPIDIDTAIGNRWL